MLIELQANFAKCPRTFLLAGISQLTQVNAMQTLTCVSIPEGIPEGIN